MTELSFAKSFLTSLDSRPTKIAEDHVEDPRNFPSRGAYILPKMPRPLPKKQKLAPGQERSLIVTLKSLRNPPLDISLSSQSLSTSVLSLKEAIESQSSIPAAKVRILYQKKPVPDSKVLKDLVGEDESISKLEFTVMVIGGAAALKSNDGEEVEPKVGTGITGVDALRTEEFWQDLNGFLNQRLKDEQTATKATALFRKAAADIEKGGR